MEKILVYGIFYFLFFLIGASIGSFLPAMIYRIRNNMPFNHKSRSQCDYCGKSLSILALVPILGYIILKGRSQCCQQKIPVIYPLIETLSGIITVYAAVIYFI